MKTAKFQSILLHCLAVFALFCSCAKKEQKTLRSNPAPQEFVLDLVELQIQNKLGKVSLITVEQDPVYHKTKKFQGVNAVDLIKNEINLRDIDIKNTKIVFECQDGYRPEMPLELFLQANPYLVFKDQEATKGSNWETIYKNGQQMTADPFYLVYPRISPIDPNYKWPYNLIKIHLQAQKPSPELFPTSHKELELGYNLFQKHCTVCHALNGKGGSMGPELNFPKNVTQYWKEKELVEFIVNPAAFRNNVKMPKLGLSQEESQQIVDYLKYMSGHKTKTSN